MNVYTWPDTALFVPDTCALVQELVQESSASPLTGHGQVLTRPGERWGWAMTLPGHYRAQRNEIEAFLLRLRGRENLVRLWDFFHEVPDGTIPLTGITLSAAASAWATTLQLAGSPDGATLKAGDWLEVGGQLFRTMADAVTVSGVMTVAVGHRVRKAIAQGAAVNLTRPTALYHRTESRLLMPRQPGGADPGFAIDFVEYIQP